MVEVPLEIEAELPREFEGSALLASSGLPRRVRLRATKDALKLSTAYRADQLVGDVVRSALRGTSGDVQRVQEAVMRFVRAVRDRRQDGATLLVSSNGRGKIDVLEVMNSARAPVAPAPLPVESPRPSAPPAADRVGALERRVAELEATLARVSAAGGLAERLTHVEQKLAPAMSQIARTLGAAEIAGPGLENHGATGAARAAASGRRGSAIEAYAEGLRGELRTRAIAGAAHARSDVERCDRAAALAIDAEILGVPADGSSQRLREASSQAAARQNALERLAGEIEFYAGPELPVAAQLLSRLEEGVTPDPAPSLEPLARAVVAVAKATDSSGVAEWLERTAALCAWELVLPSPGEPLAPEWHDAVDAGGDTVTAALSPRVRRSDGSTIARARVRVANEAATTPVPAPPAPAVAASEPVAPSPVAASEPAAPQ